MRARLDGDVELLERSLAYAAGVLASVTEADLHRPTPCAAWDLDRLLLHLGDALDAFREAAAGVVAIDAPRASTRRAEALRDKTTALLGAWVAGPDLPVRVRLGDTTLDAALLVRTAALEVAVHSHDVAVALARPHPLPEDLARGLLAVARDVVRPDDRPGRFAAPRTTPTDPTYADRLLGYLGRPADRAPVSPPVA